MAGSKTAAAAAAADADRPPEHARPFQTAVRESITPYLPPPLVRAMKEIDPRLEPLVGPEASVTLFGSLLLAWTLFRLLSSRTAFSSGSSSLGSGTKNTAIQEDDRDKDILPSDAETSRPFDGTVLLCGPSLGGKTSLFYRLLQQQRGGNDSSSSGSNTMGTVRSIKSNTGFLDGVPNDETGGASTTTLRILDTPGHWGPQKLLRAVPLREVRRLVVVVDSTQPVAPAADYLRAVLKSTMLNGSGNDNGNGPRVLIACHKRDHPKAKNARRIKLQLRSELIRLSKLEGGNDESESDDWEEILNGVPLCSSSVADCEAVREFCETGTAPTDSKKR